MNGVPVVLVIDEQQLELLMGLLVTAKAATGLMPEEAALLTALQKVQHEVEVKRTSSKICR